MHAELRALLPKSTGSRSATILAGARVSRRRKPEPGMLLDAAAALGLDLARPGWSATAGGTSTAAAAPGFGRSSSTGAMPRNSLKTRDFIVGSFSAAADVILR